MAKKKIKSADDMCNDYLQQNEDIYDELIKDGVDITKISDVNVGEITNWISTGSFLLDASITNSFVDSEGKLKLGIAGGKIMYISGTESTGKSILAAHILKNAQQQNALCAYIDGEQAVNKKLFQDIGVDFSKNKLIYSENNIVEKNFELIEKIVMRIAESKNPDRLGLVIWDSIASTTTLNELEMDYDDKSYGSLAKNMSLGFRKIIRMINKHNVAIVFTNQLRANMKMKNMYDDPFVEPGGQATNYYSSLSLRLVKPSKSDRILNSKGQQIGTKIKIKFRKNRYGPPQNDLSFSLYYGRGIDDDANLYYWLKDNKFLTARGANSTIKIDSVDEFNEYKFETSNWKKLLNENNGEFREKLRKFVVDEIRIDLNDDTFYDSNDDSDGGLSEFITDVENDTKEISELD